MAATRPENVFLVKSRQSPNDRFDYLRWNVFSGMNCPNAADSRRNLYILLREAYREAKPLAITASQQAALNSMRELAKSSWLALALDQVHTAIPPVPPHVLEELK